MDWVLVILIFWSHQHFTSVQVPIASEALCVAAAEKALVDLGFNAAQGKSPDHPYYDQRNNGVATTCLRVDD